MATDLITYLKLDDVNILKQRFDNLELLVSRYKAQHEYLRRIFTDSIFAAQELDKWREKIEECRVDMNTIVEAIEIINQPEDDDDEMEDDEDE